RDKLVTGVQTCALPISQGSEVFDRSRLPPPGGARSSAAPLGRRARRHSGLPARTGESPPPGEEVRRGRAAAARSLRGPEATRGRSEERRVGKECRARWA